MTDTVPITDTAEVTGILDVDGRSAFVLSRTTTRYGTGPALAFTSYAAIDGDNEWTRADQEDAAWEQSQKAPLDDGTSWSADGERKASPAFESSELR